MKLIKLPVHLLAILEKEAGHSNVDRSKMAAAVLAPDWLHLISKTHNIRIYGKKTKWTLHAEERLMLKHRGNVDTVIVYRANGSGTSKPCYRCTYAMRAAGVKKVIYNDGVNWVTEKTSKLYKFA